METQIAATRLTTRYGPYSNHRLEVGNCGFSFYHQYVARKKKGAVEERSVASDRGSAAHEVLEKITKLYQRDNTQKILAEEIKQWVFEAVTRYPLAYSEIGEIVAMAKRYAANPPHLSTEAKTEVMLALKFEDGQLEQCEYDDPAAIMRGRIDIFDMADDLQTATIYDHKTQPNIETADTLQMGIYAWLVKRCYPFLKEVRTVLHFARYDRYSQPVAWNDQELREVEDHVLMQVELLENRQSWEATPHKGCQYCPVINRCPAMQEHVSVGEDGKWHVVPRSLKILGSTAKAVQVAGLINVLEEVLKGAKDELKEFVKKAQAPVAIPGKVFGFHASEPKVDWDLVNAKGRDKIYAILQKHRLDPKDYMSFNPTYTNRIWRLGNGALFKELQEALPSKVETRFEGKKA